MAVALPAGWIDTGVVANCEASGTLEVFAGNENNSIMPSTVFGADFRLWTGSSTGNLWLSLDLPQGPTVEIWRLYIPDYPYTPPLQMAPAQDYSQVEGPFRLGVTYRLIDPESDPHPEFAQIHYELAYAWFMDASTKGVVSFAGHSYTGYHLTGGDEPAPPDTVPRQIDVIGTLGWIFNCQTGLGPGTVVIRVTNWQINGATVDASELSTALLHGGSGEVDAWEAGHVIVSADASAPFTVTEDIDISRFGGGSTGAQVRDADGNLHTCPYAQNVSHQVVSWTTTAPSFDRARNVTIDSDWAAAQPVPFRSDDLQVPLMQSPKGRDGGTYTPIQITIPFELDLLRPDGGFTTAFVSPDDKIDVNDVEGNHYAQFTVHATGGAVSRTLRSGWKDRVGLGPDGKTSPPFDITAYQHTKHFWSGVPNVPSNEDIYAWDIFTQMELDITATSAATLTVRLDGNYLDIYDPHTTGSDRTDNYTADLYGFTYHYTVDVQAGQHTYYVDLCFPTDAAGPVYPSRVDQITLSGFNVGTYTLNEWELEARGNAYLKIDFGPPVQRGDYSAIMLSIDGSFGLGNLPDKAYKPDETGQYGGGIRYVEIVTSLVLDPPFLDVQYDPAAMAGYLDAIEGINASYSQSAEDAFLKDTYGNTLGPGLAQWIRPVVPYQGLIPTVPYAPPCSVQCRRVVTCNAMPFTIYSRWNAGHGAIEALVPDADGGRAPSGIALTAGYGSQGVTDAFGYVVVSPVPADGPGSSLTYSLEGA